MKKTVKSFVTGAFLRVVLSVILVMLNITYPNIFSYVPFVFCLCDSVLFGTTASVFGSVFCGVLQDAFSVTAYHTLCYTLTSFLGTTIHQKLYHITPFVVLLCVLFGVLVQVLLRLLW